MNSNLLRDLPRVDDLLSALISRPDTIKLPRVALLDSIRITLDDIRNTIKSGNANTMPNFNNICDLIADHALKSRKSGILPVINATGVVLHTNLGRAPIGENIAKQTIEAAAGYCALELDLETGQRGQRGSFCEDLLIRLTGCESALVVNNNAAAVLLALSAICAGRQIICSRGELVEIGGSFRIPEIITQGGVRLVEIGTTNRTRIADYAAAINPETAAILKVHTSNYKICGFTESASLPDLARLASENEIPLIYDLGGGALIKFDNSEPAVAETVPHADLLCISGDKLLGGPQAGIILGKKTLISRLRAHPLYRALRPDKLTLAALQFTLQAYADNEIENIPIVSMFSQTTETLRQKAEALAKKIPVKIGKIQILEINGAAGGGSLPGVDFPSFAVGITPEIISVNCLANSLRSHSRPIICRIQGDALLFDVRTLMPFDDDIIAMAIFSICEEASHA